MKRLKTFTASLLSFIIALSTSALAQDKAPISHESMWLMKRAGAPSPSPDGKWVVFSLVEPAYDEREQSSDLWIAPADRSARPHADHAHSGRE